MNQLDLGLAEMENESLHSEEHSMLNCVLENVENIVSSNEMSATKMYFLYYFIFCCF